MENSLIQNRVGQQFGNYRLTQLIGGGGYAQVYLAEHIHLPNVQHAIKILTGANLQNEQREEFLLEARTISRLQLLNPHIVEIRDFGIQPDLQGINSGTPYLVMEYAREKTLRQLYPRGTQVPLDRILFYVSQIAEALQCVHDQEPPIIHRDIKPENMLLRDRDHALLSDFGIAISGKTGVQGIAGEKGLIGTATYMAPERFRRQTRRASDQYSLAIMVYEWLSGYPPFRGSDTEICVQHLNAPPPRLYPTYVHITPEIEAVVMRALSKDPDARFENVREFALALANAIQAAQNPNGLTNQSTLLPVSPGNGQINGSGSPLPGNGQFGQGPMAVPPSPVLPGNTQSISGQAAQPQPPPPSLPGLPPFRARPTRHSGQTVRDFFELSTGFASDRRYSLFRWSGMLLNILSAVALGALFQNALAVVPGLLFSVVLFALCVRAVDPDFANFTGTLVSLYWGVVGWIIGENLVAWFQFTFNPGFSALFLGIVFCLISFSLHRWYVTIKYR